MAKRARAIINESQAECGNVIAWAFPASFESVSSFLNSTVDDDDGRSPWTWIRLSNGDLVLGIFPRGETYFAVENDAGDVEYVEYPDDV